MDRGRLRLWLALFFVALAIPTSFLIYQAQSRLQWELFHRHQLMAEELARRIDSRLGELIDQEEQRPFGDYAFLVVAGDPAANYVQRSPLSAYPVESAIPGLLGYFQLDAAGAFSSPLLPPVKVDGREYGLTETELNQRRDLADRLGNILTRNRMVRAGNARRPSEAALPRLDDTMDESTAPIRQQAKSIAPSVADGDGAASKEQAAESLEQFFGQRSAPEGESKAAGQRQLRLEDLKLGQRFQAEETAPSRMDARTENRRRSAERVARKELSALPDTGPAPPHTPANTASGTTETASDYRVSVFESEIDPFELSLLDSGHFVLFRKVWRERQRYIQGALIEPRSFLDEAVGRSFRDTTLSRTSDLVVAFQGNVLTALYAQDERSYPSGAAELTGDLLYRTALSTPLDGMELVFSVAGLPAEPGGRLVTWVALSLAIVLTGGLLLTYRLGVRQMELARQQQDFVSAVSHELRTPLTSIRMYGEILREGWASEEKKRTYYEYIHDESERLSRLIGNVLQLARMNREELQLDLRPRAVGALMNNVRSKISSQIERAGFELDMECEAAAAAMVIQVDDDAFTQILINLVDNAIKFSGKSAVKHIELRCRTTRRNRLVLRVRDYGPGVAKDQMKDIFKLFYRSENELTRETVGTGIGLALVNQLTRAMGGQVDVVNCEPGAEFRIWFRTFPGNGTGNRDIESRDESDERLHRRRLPS